MITKVGMNVLYNNTHINFGKKEAERPEAKEKEQEGEFSNNEFLRSMDLISKARAAETKAARAMSEEEEIKALDDIYSAASKIIDETNKLYEDGNIIREDGSSVKIIATNEGKETMYETSADLRTTKRSYFKNGKLQEIRIPMKAKNGIPREVIIKTYSDGKSLKDYEFKLGKNGEGTVDTLVTYTEDGKLVAYMGKVARMLSESALYINL